MAEVIANFSAGPAALPAVVREKIAEGLALGADHAPSLIEISHRGAVFSKIAEELIARLRSVMEIEKTHHLLLLQGGASQQFAQFPLNFAGLKPAAFLLTGHWGEKAMEEAHRVGSAVLAGSSQDTNYTAIPSTISIDGDWAYLHYTGNETIHGVQFSEPPNLVKPMPLVADLSSEFLSRPYDFQRLAGFYAGAQKNLGVAGMTVVCLSKAWLDDIDATDYPKLPKYLDYRSWIETSSMFNTPTTFAWWVALEMLRWIESVGGLEAMGRRNERKAKVLYECIDATDFYINAVAHDARSTMNIPFRIKDQSLHAVFVEEAEASGLLGLKGHRAVGGLRASLYNAIDEAAVDCLVDFMREFERRHG